MNSCTIAYAFYESDYRVRRYAEAVTTPGSRADAIALRAPGKAKTEVINGVVLHRIQERNFDDQGGPLDYLLKMGTFFLKSSAILLVNHLRYRYKIINIHNVPDFFVFTALVPRLLGVKVVFDIHDIMPEFFCERFHKPLDSAPAKILRVIEKLAVHFSSFVITGNDLWREKIASRDHIQREKCIGMVNYPHLELFRDIEYRIRDNSYKIIYPGHLSHHHGIDIAVKAMPLVIKEIPAATLEIYAASWIPQYRTQLEQLIKELSLERSVTIHPPLDIRELVNVYKAVDVGIVPKRGGLFASEAFSSKILDFMASGIPIVASRTTIDEFYFNDSQITFFEPDDHKDLARKIVGLFNDPARRLSQSKIGKEYADLNNWDVKKKVYLDIVYSLVKDTDNGHAA